jgi:hypothetical protein
MDGQHHHCWKPVVLMLPTGVPGIPAILHGARKLVAELAIWNLRRIAARGQFFDGIMLIYALDIPRIVRAV